jgi:hypothetical protein
MQHFASWASFGRFRNEVSDHRRYVRTAESEAFLKTVSETCKSRVRNVKEGMILYRAQLGNDWRPETLDKITFNVAIPHPPARMKPLLGSAVEGRVNPKGIPYLYLSTAKQAAMSEVRPWLGATVSLAQFAITRPLSIIDCSVLHDKYTSLAFLDRKFGEDVPPEHIDDIVWSAIDQAFSEPVTNTDNLADYAATQTLAELFRHDGYDGVAYKSAFGEDAFNIALFDLSAAEQINAMLYNAMGINFKFEQSGNPYFITTKALAGATSAEAPATD